VLFRYQVQGPMALELVERVFGGPLPDTKFFHSTPVVLDGRRFRALRHGMAGQAGYEFIGDHADAEAVKQAFIEAGEEFGLVQVGALAYSSNGIESGWIPTPTPGIYTDPGLAEYREWLSLFTLEGQRGLQGTWFSEDLETYYVSPYELGYGRSISFNHDFIGRDALKRLDGNVRRTKVTLEVDPQDARELLGEQPGFFISYARYRIEAESQPIGMTFYTAYLAHLHRILALSLVANEHANPGSEVTLVFGEHPGPGNDPDGEFGFKRLRATVRPAPYNEFARTRYREN
jgi:glycine cleavage system aminomethyltransferase T